MTSALVEIAKDSKRPLVPSVMAGGDGVTMGGLPGLLLAMAAKDLGPLKDGPARKGRGAPRSASAVLRGRRRPGATPIELQSWGQPRDPRIVLSEPPRRPAGPVPPVEKGHLPMKIRRITATPINLTLEAPYLWVFGTLDGFSPTIVEVETEDG